MVTTTELLAVFAICYLIGAFPTAYIIGKLKGINIFEQGSGNMGGANVSRELGVRWGLIVTLLDILKGFLALLVVREGVGYSFWTILVGSAGVVIGHVLSIFASLLTASIENGRIKLVPRGGKGASTAFGTMLHVAPPYVSLIMFLIAAVGIFLTRYVSLGVLVGWTVGLVWLVILIAQEFLPVETLLYVLLIMALILVRFLGNIRRLLTGTERQLRNTS